MPLLHFYQGAQHRTVTFVTANGRDEVREYLESMQKPDRAKMVALLHLAANHGPPFNRPDRCKRLDREGFYEFKTHSHRIFWFMQESQIVLMTAFSKKQDKTPESELKRGRHAQSAIVAEHQGEHHDR